MSRWSAIASVFLGLVATLPSVHADEAMDANTLISQTKARVPRIETEELKRMIDEDEDFVLLDVRMPDEIKGMGKIPARQQVEIPRGWLEVRIFNQVLDRSTPIVAYCGAGIRSAFAADTLRELGFTDVRNYEEGLIGWSRRGHPVAK